MSLVEASMAAVGVAAIIVVAWLLARIEARRVSRMSEEERRVDWEGQQW